MNLSTPHTAQSGTVIQVLLKRLIDYAGLFPPASLDMLPAATNYDAYSRSPHSWMLGRFIVPAARLPEFEEAFAALPQSDTCPELSVLVGLDEAADMAHILAFRAKMARSGSGAAFVIASVEAKAATAEDVHRLSAMIPPELEAYFEVPLSGGERECLAAIGECGHAAKIRTGGETAGKFPDSGSVAAFLHMCAEAKVAFKATAGLHHPLRSVHRLTYKSDSPSGMMHGFLNVFLAAAFIYAGMETKVAQELLEEQLVAAFRFDAGGVFWREHRLGRRELAAARERFSVSFGSCSFTEPVDDLLSLGLL